VDANISNVGSGVSAASGFGVDVPDSTLAKLLARRLKSIVSTLPSKLKSPRLQRFTEGVRLSHRIIIKIALAKMFIRHSIIVASRMAIKSFSMPASPANIR
jgi:hypothetical protein